MTRKGGSATAVHLLASAETVSGYVEHGKRTWCGRVTPYLSKQGLIMLATTEVVSEVTCGKCNHAWRAAEAGSRRRKRRRAEVPQE